MRWGVLRVDEATRIIPTPALDLQHGRVLFSIRDPGHVDCVFIRDLDSAVVLIREDGIREVVRGENGRGGCGGLRGYWVETLEEGEDEGCGGKEVVGKRHRGDLW